ncbi:Hypothetical predicted protein [Mytilus galloprovincialis]|uniref:Prolyl 4-hydroxylase alpha subunit domain-containing protein n=1 Tax=Mytilus galloprovincialis TaxID=29158 RepID=A0A8B6F6W4_MYTGA|nr:Hypothetical predicted protein [Mytilus galloprovincialis]
MSDDQSGTVFNVDLSDDQSGTVFNDDLSDDQSGTVFNDDFVTELLAVVITAGETDAEKLRRYELSAETNKIKYKVLDIQQPWRHYDVVVYTEGGYKVNVLKENLEEYAMKENLVILITDSPDSVILDSSREILKRFKRFDARIVFATDNSCWPKNQIKSQYPSVGTFDNRYLSAGAFIGYAKDIFNMVNHRTINDMESDQLYYSEIFVNNELRGKFLRIADYLTGAWTSSRGCLSCAKNRINLNNFEEDAYPNVQLSVFIDEPTPFITEAMELIGDLDYPKSKMNLFVYVHDEFHYKDVEIFISNVGSEYNSMTIVNHEDKMSVSQARNWALLMCKQRKCDYYFAIEGHVHLTDPRTLKDLIEHNRTVIAPLLVRHNEIWSNFWGALSNDGYYERSDDYIDIVEYVKKGLWNVPHITSAYLINGSCIDQLQDVYVGEIELSYEMNFAKNLRNKPCNDVVRFPVFTELFCDHLVEEMENSGKWSAGKNKDDRISGGYENVPTVDIHMNQIGFEDVWLQFIRLYARPLQRKVFIGYKGGGGTRFVRQNCSVTDVKKGWMLMHPGRLTHYHEGLEVTSGTRYIAVSFVDP